MGCRGARRPPVSSSSRCARLPARDGHGRRQARPCCSARCSAASVTVGLMVGLLAALVPAARALARRTARSPQAWRSRSRPSSPSGRSSRSLPGDAIARLVSRHLRANPPGAGIALNHGLRSADTSIEGIWHELRARRPTSHFHQSRRSRRRRPPDAQGDAGQLRDARRPRRRSRRSPPRSSRATGSPPPAGAPAPARSPRRCATRGTRSRKASPARSPGATTCPSSISRRSASSPAPPSSCRCSRSSASSRSRSPTLGDRLRVAIADPGNIHGIDELRLASGTRSTSASRAATTSSPRSSRSPGSPRCIETQSALDDFDVIDEDEDDLEVDDGVSDAPLVRLVNSIIMQAATDGASDIHFEPQEDSLARARARRRRAQRGAAHPEADGQRRHDPAEGAREARHRRAAQAAGRPDLARTRARSGACSTSASPCCRRSRASRS